MQKKNIRRAGRKSIKNSFQWKSKKKMVMVSPLSPSRLDWYLSPVSSANQADSSHKILNDDFSITVTIRRSECLKPITSESPAFPWYVQTVIS